MPLHRFAVAPARLLGAALALVLLFVALAAAATPAAGAAASTASAAASTKAGAAVAKRMRHKSAKARRAARQRKALARCLRRARKARTTRVRAARVRSCRKMVRAARVSKPKRSPSPSKTDTTSGGDTTGTTQPAPAPVSSPTTSASGAVTSGVSVGGAFQNQDSTTLTRDLDSLNGVGARWIRIDINWAQIQGAGPASYNWTNIDRVVQGATARGMKVLGVIAYTPAWARPAGTTAKYGPDPATYAAFAMAAARHYAALGVHHYEVWNEPNLVNFWEPKPDVAAYTRLLKAAYPAIKGGDPQATVITGGTAPAVSNGTNIAPVDFLKGIYANGGGGFFDAVGHHPYCWPAYPGDAETWSPWYQMYGTGTNMRSVMTANGDSAKKIWGTEFGAPTNGPAGSHVSEDVQAAMLAKGYSLWKGYEWAGPLFTYSGRDLGTSTTDRENFFGMFRFDFSRKPGAAAFQAAATA